jgi:hypothetical protein
MTNDLICADFLKVSLFDMAITTKFYESANFLVYRIVSENDHIPITLNC